MVPNIDALIPLVTVVLPIRIRLRQMILCPLSPFFYFYFHIIFWCNLLLIRIEALLIYNINNCTR